MTYRVDATRSDGWWVLIAHLPHRKVASQARRLDQAPDMIREAIAIVLDVDDESTIDVEIRPQLGEELDSLVEEAVELREKQHELGRKLSAVTQQSVRQLRSQGLSVRDVAALVGLTAARVSQIERKPPAAKAAR